MGYEWGENEVYILTAFDKRGKAQEFYAESLEDAARFKEYLLNDDYTRVEVSDKKELRPWRYMR